MRFLFQLFVWLFVLFSTTFYCLFKILKIYFDFQKLNTFNFDTIVEKTNTKNMKQYVTKIQ